MRTSAALLGALLAAIAAATAQPATYAAPVLIAYSDSNGSLYVSSLQGTNANTIFTSDNTTTMEPLALSSDSSQVLAIEVGAQTQLVLVPAAGGAPVPVAGTSDATSGALSPDGTKIAFALSNTSGANAPGIYTVSVSGGTPKLVEATPADATDALPTFSPDGTKLAFARDAYDAQGNETVSLELIPSAGGSPTALTTGLAPDLESGGHITFSPNGKLLAYAGDYTNPGIFTVPVAGGNPTQLTSDYDYWPSFSTDGSTVFFSRDSTSTNADDNASAPVDAINDDVYELWTVKSDGTGAAVSAEGDFENLALAAIATSATPPSAATTPVTTTPNPNPNPNPSPTTTTTTTTPVAKQPPTPTAKTPAKPHERSATGVLVTSKGSHYTVKWSGKATSWTVTLKVGRKSAKLKLKGSVHSHVFVLLGAHGAASARVQTP